MALPGVLGIVRRDRVVSVRSLLTLAADALSRRRTSWPSGHTAMAPAAPATNGGPRRAEATRRWTDARHAPPGDFSTRAIPDAALTSGRVPRHGDTWDAVFDFALSYDGYAYWDGLAELAGRVLRRWTRDQSLPEDLGQLRACLFYEQRRWHHFGDDPAGRSAHFMWALVDTIRTCVDAAPAQSEVEATTSSSPPRPEAVSVRTRHVELVLAAEGHGRPSNGSAAWVYPLRRPPPHPTASPTGGLAVRAFRPMTVAEALPKPPVIVRAPRCIPAGRDVVSLSIRRVTTSFVGDDPEYAGWLRANPGGFVLNVTRRASPARATLHLAGCAAIRPVATRNGQASTMRVCAPSAAALAAWTSTELRRDPARCLRCHP